MAKFRTRTKCCVFRHKVSIWLCLNDADLVFFTAIGLGGRLYQCILNYLQRRNLLMSTAEDPASCHVLKTGVPQGSFLTQLVFVLSVSHQKFFLTGSRSPAMQIFLFGVHRDRVVSHSRSYRRLLLHVVIGTTQRPPSSIRKRCLYAIHRQKHGWIPLISIDCLQH